MGSHIRFEGNFGFGAEKVEVVVVVEVVVHPVEVVEVVVRPESK